ncbi:MAG: hypothetical protein R3C53_26905 [Pirellulaceae bacterium]
MQVTPSIPRSTTWEILEKSRNTAAVATLTTGLGSACAELRHRSLQCLVARKEDKARRAIVLNWERYDQRDQDWLRKEPQQFSQTASELLAHGSSAEKHAALAAIGSLDLADSIATVLEIATTPRHALHVKATECLFDMCVRWGQQARIGKDVPSIRTTMLERLNACLASFRQHKNQNLVEAWLCLVHWEDSVQRGMISDPRQDAYRSVLKQLANSQRTPILQLLGGYLWRATTPKSVLGILVERSEPELAIEIAKLTDANTLPMALKRLGTMPPLASLENLDIQTLPVSFDVQRKLWLMQAASLNDLPRVLDGAIRLSKLGTSDARQTAAEMLRRCRRPEIETLVPAIQASTVNSGEELCLADLMVEIAGWLNSPSQLLMKAATEFLSDFTLEKLLEQVRHWPSQMCRAMAAIVSLTDENFAERLSLELQCPAPKRRLAALQVTEMLGCADAVSEWLMPLLEDSRLDVRVKVIDLLSALGHESLETLIPQLLQDASTDIQDAANRAVRRQARHKN